MKGLATLFLLFVAFYSQYVNAETQYIPKDLFDFVRDIVNNLYVESQYHHGIYIPNRNGNPYAIENFMGNMTTALGIAKELVKNNRRYTATIAARTIVKALLTDSYSLHDAVQYRWVENWAKENICDNERWPFTKKVYREYTKYLKTLNNKSSEVCDSLQLPVYRG